MYLNRTEEWRRVNNETQLVLSYIQSHKQMVPSTISGWLKNVLKSSAINVSLLTAHLRVQPQLQRKVLLVDQ